MPVVAIVRKHNGKFRLIDKETGKLIRNGQGGKPVDGGGHESEAKANRQATAINSSGKK